MPLPSMGEGIRIFALLLQPLVKISKVMSLWRTMVSRSGGALLSGVAQIAE